MRTLFTLVILVFSTISFCQTYTYVDPNPQLEKEKLTKEAFFKDQKDNAFTKLQICTKQCGSYAADANDPKDPCTLPGVTPACICNCQKKYDKETRDLEQQEKNWRIDFARREKNYESQQKQKQILNNQIQSNNNAISDINNSIEDVLNTLKDNLDKSQKQEEKDIEPTDNSNPSDLSPEGMYDKGVYAQYTDHDMENALNWYLQSAKAGYTEAMSTLSDYYSNEATANYARATHWWLLAYNAKSTNFSSLSKIINAFGQNKYQPVDYTDVFSIFNITVNEIGFAFLSIHDSTWVIHSLGTFYEKGLGCNVNLEKAFDIQLKNARAGNIMSMVDLGVYYVDGKGTSKNYQEALRWFIKAIDMDNSFRHMNSGAAMCALGYMYQYGLGVEQSIVKAKEWYQKSSDALFEPAKTQLQKIGN